jgi:mono/diheme cytochrome c family protein
VATGIGSWTPGDFWRALHNGRSKSGRLLYPAFPYTNTTLVTREDADAIFAFLRTVPAVRQPNRAHEMRFPYDNQAALALWRALYFRPAVFAPQADQSAEWNRGAYLVRGLGHCDACHAKRNALGATDQLIELGGGLIPVQNWYAPSLASAREAGVAEWSMDEVVALLKTGATARGSVLGPMAEVVFHSTQHLDDADLRAIAVFLRALPPSDAPAPSHTPPPPAVMALGADLYTRRCADCHGPQGEGARGAIPPLAGNRKLTMASATNVIRVIVEGGFAPATAGNPRPYGMPPFGHSLSREEIAAVATYVRNAWGHRASAVSELEVMAFK